MLLTILAKADVTRILKAAHRLCTGVYRCTITRRSAEELQGMVWNGQGAAYHVSVWDGWIVARAWIPATTQPSVRTLPRWCSTPFATIRTCCKEANKPALRLVRM